MNMNDYDRSNYNRKHQVIWHEDLLLYTSGCKSWPNNNFDYNELLKKVEDRKKLQNSDDIVLHDMLKDTISQRTTPRFEANLIMNTRDDVIKLNDQEIITETHKRWDRVK